MITPTQSRRPFHDTLSPAEKSRILEDTNATFKLLYWEVGSVGATPRDLLAYGQANWKNEIATTVGDEWGSPISTPTPFGVVPLLTVTSSDGKEAFVSESIVIDHYLAKRFHLLGDNEWDELSIKGLYNNIHYFRERAFSNLTWTFDDKRREAYQRFIENSLPRFIADHEFHLKANGSNGHYIGDKLSLADIHLANIVDHFAQLPSGDIYIAAFKKSQEIWKVKEAVEQDPNIAAWRASKEWKAFANGSIETYSMTAVPQDPSGQEQKGWANN